MVKFCVQVRNDVAFYEPLGLVANPFIPHTDEDLGVGTALEIAAASNSLFAQLVSRAASERPGVVIVDKSPDIPSYYPLRAIGNVESMLINDDALRVLHAYIPLFTLRRGRIRSTLAVVAERLAFRSFDQTLAVLLERVLARPDESIPSYAEAAGGPLDTLAERLSADPLAAVEEYFGAAELERRPELAEVVDIRLAGLDADVVEDENALEVDATVGDAPGTGIALPAPDEGDDAEARERVVAYVLDYVATHLSPVIARGLRMYRERGLAALSAELKVTRAPRKTLRAVVELACASFKKVAIIYDGFENWNAIEPDTKTKILGAFTEMAGLLEDRAIFCFLLERGVADEIREAFPAAHRVRWDFGNLERLQTGRDPLDTAIAREWYDAATLPGHAVPGESTDATLAALAERAGGDLARFAEMAAAAIEDAASRRAGALDAAALEAGLSAHVASAGAE